MGLVVFTAKRSPMPGRVAGSAVALDVDLSDAVRSRIVYKNVKRASSGDPETLYQGADTQWEFEFAPVAGQDYARLREFLDSTAGGEIFQIWPYGTEAAAKSVRRTDDGRNPQQPMPTGQKNADLFVERITVIEV